MRRIALLVVAGCSPLIDRDAANYIPFAKYSRYVYLDQDGERFVLTIQLSDSFYAILDWQGRLERLRYDGSWVHIDHRVEYSLNGSRILAYSGFIPYYSYPFVDGFNRSFTYAGNGFQFEIASSTFIQEGLRYGVEISYRESNPEGGRTFYRLYVFAPDTGIVEALIGPDTVFVAGDTLISQIKSLTLEEEVPLGE